MNKPLRVHYRDTDGTLFWAAVMASTKAIRIGEELVFASPFLSIDYSNMAQGVEVS